MVVFAVVVEIMLVVVLGCGGRRRGRGGRRGRRGGRGRHGRPPRRRHIV